MHTRADIDILRGIAVDFGKNKDAVGEAVVFAAVDELRHLRAQDVGGNVGSAAARDVLAERRRQVEAEGWTPEHDDEHDKCEMAVAAACYAIAPSPVSIEREWTYPDMPKTWPWAISWWRPGFYRRNLVKAGALIIAEIERWDRAEARRLQAAECGADRGATSASAEIPTPAH